MDSYPHTNTHAASHRAATFDGQENRAMTAHETNAEPRVPPGWMANPSAWRQRIPLVALALVGAAIAGYHALFQLGVTPGVWEPFFGDGSRHVLTSGLSRVLPIPDAALGFIGYAADAAAGLAGGEDRWRRRPWLVLLFGFFVGPLGAVSVTLVILQPLAFGAYCTLCLLSAVVSIVLIGPAMDEILASLQHLARTRRRGESVWEAFLGHDPSASLSGAAADA
jgi:hypothetical protein